MSRRKQSNPKPIKRETDDEDISDKTVSSVEDSSVPSDGEKSENEKEPQKQTGPLDDNKEANGLCQGDALLSNNSDVFKSTNFPNDVICIKKINEDEDNASGRQWSVCTAIPLPRSSSIGPTSGEIVSLHDIKFGEVVIQFCDSRDEPVFVKLTDDTGNWLALLQLASEDTPGNTHVYYEGGRVWCEVISDLELGAEMVASFTIQSEEDLPNNKIPSPMEKSMKVVQSEDKILKTESMDTTEADSSAEQLVNIETKAEPPKSPKVKSTDTGSKQKADPPAHAALIYGCPFCSVRFSSLRTLEGHLAYYCSKKPPDFVAVPDLKGAKKTDDNEQEEESKNIEAEVNGEKKLKRLRPSEEETGNTNENDDKSKDSSQNDADSPPSKSLKLRHIFRCPYCSYSADKLSSLNRHRRIHNRGSITENEKPAVPTSVSRSETYCTSCNIQFSSIGTYNCHKEHYCSKREQQTPSPDSTNSDNSQMTSTEKSSNLITSHSSNTVQLPPADLLRQQVMSGLSAASLIPGQTTVILAAPIVAPNGVPSMAFGMPTVIVQPVMHAPPSSQPSKTQPSEAHQGSNAPKLSPNLPSEQPLDLSTSKISRRETLSPSDNEGRLSPVSDTEANKSIKSEPKSPNSSPCRKSVTPTSPRSSGATPSPPKHAPLTVPTVLPTVFPFKQVTQPKVIPPLPHSVSKCMECNIVFYKHENYMIHKEHYCSSRRTRSESPKEGASFSSSTAASHMAESEAEMSQTDQSKSPKSQTVNGSLSPSLPISSPVIKDGVVYRFYCIPCKIKFSSASTLKAHKEFYCPHGKESDKVVFSNESETEKCDDLDKSETGKTEEEGQFTCSGCGGVFTSSRLLKLHMCTGLSTQVSLLRCPCCDFVTQTEVRLSDHMKVHIPTKAYKCSLCGYRGNTVRGMRMHGKMHIDNGEPFSDDNMTEFEEPPLVPVQLNGHSDSGPLDVEAELIRLKNEPYKRRRSRKSYDKSENAMYIPGQAIKSVCSLCRESFSDVNNFLIHMRLHEMAALEMAKSLKCRYCDTVSPTIDTLMSHIQTSHSDRLSPRFSVNPTSHNKTSPKSDFVDSDNSESNQENDSAKKLKVLSVKQEPPDPSPSPSTCNSRSPVCPENSTAEIFNKNSENLGSDSAECSSRAINFNSCDEVTSDHSEDDGTNKHFEIHTASAEDKDFQIKRDPDENSTNSCGTAEDSTYHKPDSDQTKKSQTVSPSMGEVTDSHVDTNLNNEPLFVKVKREISENMSDSPPPKREISPVVTTANVTTATAQNRFNAHSMIPNLSLFGAQSVLSLFQMQHGVPSQSLRASLGETKPETSSSVLADSSGLKYCKQCDIKFTYQSSFLAHKKHYCSGRTADNVSPSATA